MKKWKTAMLVLVGLAAIGALIIGIITPAPPDAAARKYYDDSLNGRLSVKQRICADRLVDAPAADLIVLGGKILGTLIGYSADTAGLRFQVIEHNRASARVRVTGSYALEAGLFSYTENVHVDETILMVREGARWKWCGSVAP